jgi:TolA-binding protein
VADAIDLQRRTWNAGSADPVVQRNFLLFADELLAAGEPLAALPCFEALSTDDLPAPVQAAGLWGAGRCLYERQAWSAALERFEQLIDAHPAAHEAAEAGLIAAQVLERLDRHDAALHQYERLLNHSAAEALAPRALLAAARLHGRLRQFPDATAKYQRLLEQFPESAEANAALYGWAWAEQEQNRPERALELFGRLNREYPQSRYWPDATFRLARRHSAAGDDAAAAPLIAELVDRLPADAELRSHARYLGAQMALRRKDWAQAAAALDQLLRESPKGALAPTAEFWRAEAAYRQNDELDAQTRFDALDALARDVQPAWRGTVPLRRAQIRAQQEQWREALAIAETIGRDYPDFAQQQEVDYLRGRCLASLGELRAAREAYRDALASPGAAKTETAAMAQWMIGETWFHQGDYPRAIREYLRGQTLYAYPRWQAASLLQAGKCSELLGDRRQAIDLYRQLIDKHREPPFVDEARQRLAELEPAVAAKRK